jgi:hypothetical protein
LVCVVVRGVVLLAALWVGVGFCGNKKWREFIIYRLGEQKERKKREADQRRGQSA